MVADDTVKSDAQSPGSTLKAGDAASAGDAPNSTEKIDADAVPPAKAKLAFSRSFNDDFPAKK